MAFYTPAGAERSLLLLLTSILLLTLDLNGNAVFDAARSGFVCSRFHCGTRWVRGSSAGISWWFQSRNSLLYVTPLYLRARTGQLPELKRVIAAYGDHVVMAETLAGALAALFPEPFPEFPPRDAPADTVPAGPLATRAHEALGHYDRALERLRAGDWGGFGAELDALRALLEALGRPPGDG